MARRGVEQYPEALAGGTPAGSQPYLPAQVPVVDLQRALMTRPWLDFERNLIGSITALQQPSGVTPGTYGDATHVGQVTVNTKGQVTAAAPVAISYPAPVDTVITRTDTGTVNNWAPGLAGNTTIVWTGTATLTITGIAGGVAGQTVTICNFSSGGAGLISLLHANAGSTAANQLSNIATSGPTPLAYGGRAVYRYTTGWTLVAHDQGAWIGAPFLATNYLGGGSMTWTVPAGAVSVDRYRLTGRTLEFSMNLAGASTTLAGTASAVIARVAYGYSTTAGAVIGVGGANNNGSIVYPLAQGGGANLNIYHDASTTAAWTLGYLYLFLNGVVEVG
jgi:hypothetical protein